jgi:hypothetical protein
MKNLHLEYSAQFGHHSDSLGETYTKCTEFIKVLDSSKTVTAEWRKDYTQLIIIVGVAGAVIAGLVIMLRRGKK